MSTEQQQTLDPMDTFERICEGHFCNGETFARWMEQFVKEEQDYLMHSFAELIAKSDCIKEDIDENDGETYYVLVDVHGIIVAKFSHSTSLGKNDILYMGGEFWQVVKTRPAMVDGVVKTTATIRNIQDSSVVLEIDEKSAEFFKLVTPDPVDTCSICHHVLTPHTSLCVGGVDGGKHAQCVLDHCRQIHLCLPDEDYNEVHP